MKLTPKLPLIFFILLAVVDLSKEESGPDINATEDTNEWTYYKSRMSYAVDPLIHNNSDETERHRIFSSNMELINRHNKQELTFKSEPNTARFIMGPNHFAHLEMKEIEERYLSEINLTEVEHSARFLNKKIQEQAQREKFMEEQEQQDGSTTVSNCSESKLMKKLKSKSNVDSVDWLAEGVLSPVVDQGGCGSCYAFSTAWAVESAFAIKYNVRRYINEFSKQQLVDCTYYDYKDDNNIVYSNMACLGGNIYRSLLYIYNNGLQLEADYPYIAQRAPQAYGKVQGCQFNANKFSLKIKNFYGINFRDVEETKRVVRLQPVIAYFYATNEFYFYRSGIFTTSKCGANNCGRVNHSVLIVGYGTENGVSYWLCKNSWGPNWGENGYFRIEMNSNMCCVEGYNMYPYL